MLRKASQCAWMVGCVLFTLGCGVEQSILDSESVGAGVEFGGILGENDRGVMGHRQLGSKDPKASATPEETDLPGGQEETGEEIAPETRVAGASKTRDPIEDPAEEPAEDPAVGPFEESAVGAADNPDGAAETMTSGEDANQASNVSVMEADGTICAMSGSAGDVVECSFRFATSTTGPWTWSAQAILPVAFQLKASWDAERLMFQALVDEHCFDVVGCFDISTVGSNAQPLSTGHMVAGFGPWESNDFQEKSDELALVVVNAGQTATPLTTATLSGAGDLAGDPEVLRARFLLLEDISLDAAESLTLTGIKVANAQPVALPVTLIDGVVVSGAWVPGGSQLEAALAVEETAPSAPEDAEAENNVVPEGTLEESFIGYTCAVSGLAGEQRECFLRVAASPVSSDGFDFLESAVASFEQSVVWDPDVLALEDIYDAFCWEDLGCVDQAVLASPEKSLSTGHLVDAVLYSGTTLVLDAASANRVEYLLLHTSNVSLPLTSATVNAAGECTGDPTVLRFRFTLLEDTDTDAPSVVSFEEVLAGNSMAFELGLTFANGMVLSSSLETESP